MEANNMKAMREALAGLIDGICFHCDLSEDCKGTPCEKMQKAKAALAKPPRACDVMSQEDLTRVVIRGFMKLLEARPEFNIVGAKALVEATISAAIKCAYDTQLVSKVEGGAE